MRVAGGAYYTPPMTRGILIVGNPSPTLDAFVAQAEARTTAVVIASYQDPKSEAPRRTKGGGRRESDPRGVVPGAGPSEDAGAPSEGAAGRGSPRHAAMLNWNPPSPISARAVVVGAENVLGSVSEALLVCAPGAIRKRLDELVPTEIDSAIDNLIKGWFLMGREVASLFRRAGAPSLSFVLSEAALNSGRDELADLAGGAVAAAYRAFAQAAVAASIRDGTAVYGFSSSEAMDDAGFASFVFRILDEGNKRDLGKWHKYGKGGLFGLR